MPFADIDAAGWAIILTAGLVGIGGIATGIANIVIVAMRDRAKIRREEQVADRVAEVADKARDIATRVEVAAQHADVVAQKAKEIVAAAVEVKNTLAAATSSTDDKLEAIHSLVNNKFGVQLSVSAVALRRLAMLTKDPEDVAAAVMAEKLLGEHDDKQAAVDARGDTR